MDEVQETKSGIREEVQQMLIQCPVDETAAKTERIGTRLFDFANFLESKIVLLYSDRTGLVPTREILKRTYDYNKIVVLPAFNTQDFSFQLMKVDDPQKDLRTGPRKFLEPDPRQCKVVPIDSIDIAFIPGIAFDEKGGRIGSGQGYYDRLIPDLPITTRKVSIAFENQIVPLVPMESHDKYVDIIITEKRVIYKI